MCEAVVDSTLTLSVSLIATHLQFQFLSASKTGKFVCSFYWCILLFPSCIFVKLMCENTKLCSTFCYLSIYLKLYQLCSSSVNEVSLCFCFIPCTAAFYCAQKRLRLRRTECVCEWGNWCQMTPVGAVYPACLLLSLWLQDAVCRRDHMTDTTVELRLDWIAQ